MKRLRVRVGDLFVTNGDYFLPDDVIHITEREGDKVGYYYIRDKWHSSTSISQFIEGRLTRATKLHKLLLGVDNVEMD